MQVQANSVSSRDSAVRKSRARGLDGYLTGNRPKPTRNNSLIEFTSERCLLMKTHEFRD